MLRCPIARLIVTGPLDDEIEKAFVQAYHKELYETPNIHAAGWVEDGSRQFVEIANQCVAVISASCSEGGGGSVLSCMHAGLIPVVNYQTSVDIDSFGTLLRDCSVECIRETVQRVANAAPRQLENDARKAWEFARANHTRERFAEEYCKFAGTIARDSSNRFAQAKRLRREDRSSGVVVEQDKRRCPIACLKSVSGSPCTTVSNTSGRHWIHCCYRITQISK